MKTQDEIRDKISELMDMMYDNIQEKNTAIYDAEQVEAICNQIDALLWVIGDRSGKPI